MRSSSKKTAVVPIWSVHVRKVPTEYSALYFVCTLAYPATAYPFVPTYFSLSPKTSSGQRTPSVGHPGPRSHLPALGPGQQPTHRTPHGHPPALDLPSFNPRRVAKSPITTISAVAFAQPPTYYPPTTYLTCHCRPLYRHTSVPSARRTCIANLDHSPWTRHTWPLTAT